MTSSRNALSCHAPADPSFPSKQLLLDPSSVGNAEMASQVWLSLVVRLPRIVGNEPANRLSDSYCDGSKLTIMILA